MQFIDKDAVQPDNWDIWFTTATGRRSFDYSTDYSALTQIQNAKRHLLTEQSFLCAYCQSPLKMETSSIEHVIPKSKNVKSSTLYHNLIAVCKDSIKDSSGKKHCDKEREDQLLPAIVFHNDANVSTQNSNAYFKVYGDGQIVVNYDLKDEHLVAQIKAFIEILNLNHENLVAKRSKEMLAPILDAFQRVSKNQRKTFWENKFNVILQTPSYPFRQYLLIYIANKLAIN
ncbi:MAG: TIGR02646 family protein [Bacteroidetes bacterium]|nr:TIGR02646 family protein [Bacteroidota bacterium]